ncbi:hypothetical protein FRB94_011775 [Tulasnella sp. JGI-2019a]|nr:hypothetical protein FRB93_002222 [Tulasnella sp. JGI-2019a]KAG9014597.1 hypothetical protein FRB94_011775 [Tulasnella sp. JGI-2019a]KAG9038932.1 hypothetical protein FRB95_013610 [Tulasnella sp. JGI-2019a]
MSYSVPAPIQKLFSAFPLLTYPAIPNPYVTSISHPTLWIAPPSDPKTSHLSSGVECLKWQAYLAFRGVKDLHIRWDIAPEAGLDGRLPTLQLASGKLLGTQKIPTWADEVTEESLDTLEGYINEDAQAESRAWVTLLEGVVHSQLELSLPTTTTSYTSWLYERPKWTLQTVLFPPPAPLTGVTTPLPPSGVHITAGSVNSRYREAMESISVRLGDDKWFLGSEAPTFIDALLFAYLYRALHGPKTTKYEVEKRDNLLLWEKRVRQLVSKQTVISS